MEKNRIHLVLLWAFSLCVGMTHANARIYGNVDKVGTQLLQQSSTQAGSAFLDGSSSMWRMFALIEVGSLKEAMESGNTAVKHFDEASQGFPKAANLVDQAVRERLKSVKPEAALKLLLLQAEPTIFKDLTAWAVEGKAEQLLGFCGTRAEQLKAKTESFVQVLKQKGINETPDNLIHELIREWRIAALQGHYVSALFAVAGQAKP